MREFLVIMRGGARFTVKADRVVSDETYIRLVVPLAASDEPIAVGVPVGAEEERAAAHLGGTDQIALFNRQEVVAVLAREHIVAESPVARGDAIPF